MTALRVLSAGAAAWFVYQSTGDYLLGFAVWSGLAAIIPEAKS